jgi:hypothetical protein
MARDAGAAGGLVQFWIAAKARQARTRSTLVAIAIRVK